MSLMLPLNFKQKLKIHSKSETCKSKIYRFDDPKFSMNMPTAPSSTSRYTVSELEVTNYKRLEMIEILNNCCISCLYLQEYKKGFAFLSKFHYFESRGGLN